MVWYLNYCQPILTNDPTINFHRYFQSSAIVFALVLYVFFHAYYHMCGPEPLEEKAIEKNPDDLEDTQKAMEDQSSNSDDKSISINGAMKEENSSYITFTNSKPNEWNKKTTRETNQYLKRKINYQIIENVTILEVQSFFPIVIGHYCVAVGCCILYSPFFQQTICTVIYSFLAIILMVLNAKRFKIAVFVVWGLMGCINVYFVLSTALEIGQAHWNLMTERCFSLDYAAYYRG